MSNNTIRMFVGVLAVLSLTLLAVQIATPGPIPKPATPPQPPPPKITWSVSQLSQTMFPGTSSTVTVSFESNQSLSAVTVDVTPSLSAIVSATPASFVSVAANQPYQITLTLTALPEFIRRSFGGTIHVRSAGRPSNTYAQPLAVNLQTDFAVITTGGVSISYPVDWTTTSTDQTVGFFPPLKQPDPQHEYIGDIFLNSYPNPNGADLVTYYSTAAPINWLTNSQSYATTSVNGLPAIEFYGTFGMITSDVFAGNMGTQVVELTDVGEAHQSDGVFDSISRSIH